MLRDHSLLVSYVQKAVESPGSLVQIVGGRLLSQLLHRITSYVQFIYYEALTQGLPLRKASTPEAPVQNTHTGPGPSPSKHSTS